MKSTRSCVLIALGWLGAATVSAQTVSAPTDSAKPQTPVLHVSSRLVVVDVVVTDSRGLPVKGLKQSDFVLLEAKKPQTVSSFEEHSASAGAPAPAPLKLPPGVFTNYTPAPAGSAVNVILLDALNTPIADQAYVRDQMLKYLKTAPAGAPVAIFGLTNRLDMLQAFTSDSAALKRTIDAKKSQTSLLLDTADDVIAADAAQDTPQAIQTGDAALASSLAYNLANFEAELQATQLQMRIRYTLDGLNQLARYLAAIPGRKNLIWFSGSFPVNILPDADSAGNPFAGQVDMADEFRQTVDLLSSAQVAVYPIDARGLMVSPTFSAANSGAQYSKPGAFSKAERSFSAKTTNEHGTMEEMARNTGGKAFVNTNGLAEAVQNAMTAGANYYTLSYIPAHTSTRGDYRTITLKLADANAHPGATLSYRRGYFADDPDSPKSARAETNKAPNALRTAALHGAPAATQILFKVAVLPASKDTEPAPLASNQPDPKAKGPWLRYMVQFAADVRSLTPTAAADGKIKLSVDLVALVYDRDGALINQIDNTVAANVNEEQLAGLRKTGLQYRQQISVPAKGSYFIRVLVNDLQGSHIGAVEVPVADVRNLPAVNLPPPRAAATPQP